jgi:hypothetical protein
MLFLIVVVLVAAGLWLTRRAVLRFAEQQRRLGRWDADGPLVETEPPPGGNRGMNERLEIIGQWHGAIVRDRRPESARLGTGEPSNAGEQPPAETPSHADRPGHSGPSTQP